MIPRLVHKIEGGGGGLDTGYPERDGGALCQSFLDCLETVGRGSIQEDELDGVCDANFHPQRKPEQKWKMENKKTKKYVGLFRKMNETEW